MWMRRQEVESVPQVVSYPLPGLSTAGGNPILSGVLVDANLSTLVQCQIISEGSVSFWTSAVTS